VAPFSRKPLATANLSADAVTASTGQCPARRTGPRCARRPAPAMADDPLFSIAICYNFGTRGIL